jgi:hypothetical protein
MKHHKLRHLAATASLALAGLFGSASAQAESIVIDVTGAQSVNLFGEDGNTVWRIDIGAHAFVTSLDWDVVLAAFAPSSLGDMQISFGNSSGLDMIDLSPDAFDGDSGSGRYTGSLDLSGWGVRAGADGVLRVELSERYKDLARGVVEGQWVDGSLTFGVSAVPEPTSAALAVLGLGVVSLRLRRRRSVP